MSNESKSQFSSTLLRGIIFLVVAGALLTIAQIWDIGLDFGDYMKVIITMGILAGVMGFVLLARNEIVENKRLRDQDYID